MNNILKIIIPILILTSIVSAQIVIYDNITTSQYQTLKITSDLCISSITDCEHSLYINNSFYKYFADGELVEIPDNTSVNVILDDPINTNLEDSYNNTKRNVLIGTMTFIQPIIIVVIGVLLLFMVFRKYGKRRF